MPLEVATARAGGEMGDTEEWPILPLSYFGDAECCGCLFGVMRDDHADICKQYGVGVKGGRVDNLRPRHQK